MLVTYGLPLALPRLTIPRKQCRVLSWLLLMESLRKTLRLALGAHAPTWALSMSAAHLCPSTCEPAQETPEIAHPSGIYQQGSHSSQHFPIVHTSQRIPKCKQLGGGALSPERFCSLNIPQTQMQHKDKQ